jgi:hypothetical protein
VNKIELSEPHVKAFAVLTRRWKRLTDLKAQSGLQANRAPMEDG